MAPDDGTEFKVMPWERESLTLDIWTCPECNWSGTECELVTDYDGDLLEGGPAGSVTVCPICGEWLNAKADRRVEVAAAPEHGEGGNG